MGPDAASVVHKAPEGAKDEKKAVTVVDKEQPFAAEPAAIAPPSSATRPAGVKRMLALHTGYVGTGYKGSSINRTHGDDGTIEQVLERAVHRAGLISDANFGSFAKIRWSRASRTDKGVHSLGTVMALKMCVEDAPYVKDDQEGMAYVDSINQHLPDNIKVFSAQKVNRRFNARHMCKSRTYEYYLPTALLDFKNDGGEADVARLALFRQALSQYLGTHAFHNYTKFRTYQPDARKDSYVCKTRCNQDAAASKSAVAAEAAAISEAKVAGAGTDAAPETASPAAVLPADGAHGAAPAAAGGTPAREAVAVTASVPEASSSAPAGDGTADASLGEGQDAKRQKLNSDGKQNAQRGNGHSSNVRRGHRYGQDADEEEGDDPGDEEVKQHEGNELDEEEEEALVEPAPADAAAATRQSLLRGRQLSFAPHVHTAGPAKRGRGGKDPVNDTYYRTIESFEASQPRPLVEGGTPCLKLRVHGNSFMLHHIRYMIGGAIAAALGLVPLEFLRASLTSPARVTLPKAPPHPLLLADCDFHDFPYQTNAVGDTHDVRTTTGDRLRLREQGTARKEAFRENVLLPSLQQLVEIPEWREWRNSLRGLYPYPEEPLQEFLHSFREWEAEAAKQQVTRNARKEFFGNRTGMGRGPGAGGPQKGPRGDGQGGSQRRGRGRGGHANTQRNA